MITTRPIESMMANAIGRRAIHANFGKGLDGDSKRNNKGDKKMGSAGRREIGIELNGKKYTIRELDLDAYGEIENFVKTKHVRLYRESARGVDPDKVEEMAIKIIKTSLSPEELGEQTSTIDCLLFSAYLGLKHNEGVTREKINEIVDMSNLDEVTNALEGMGEEDDENPPEAETESP